MTCYQRVECKLSSNKGPKHNAMFMGLMVVVTSDIRNGDEIRLDYHPEDQRKKNKKEKILADRKKLAKEKRAKTIAEQGH